jgi:hypothetical protein
MLLSHTTVAEGGGGPSPGTNLCGEGDKVPGGEDVVVAHHGGGGGEGLPEEH